MRTFCTAVLLILLAAVPAVAQGNPAVIQHKLQEIQQAEKAKEVLRQLTQHEYRAKADIPAVDGIFVQDGKVNEALYRYAMRENAKALRAGAVTKVSSVKIMDHGVQIYLATDSCALIGISASPVDTADMPAPELVKLAQKSLAPLFEALPPKTEKPEKAEPKAETKEEVKKNN